nr:GNAT family N-acetyltransferase [uncultured Caproiciproducens sp.]
MSDLFLDEPNKKYQKSFENYVLIYKKHDPYYFNLYEEALKDFNKYINDLYDNSKGKNVPQNWVPTSTFWLIDEDEVVGVVRIRHQEIESAGHIGYDISPYYRNQGYGTLILKLALIKAARLGIDEAILTCSINNIASKNIIENNNGVLIGTVFDEEENENLYRFRIQTTNSFK